MIIRQASLDDLNDILKITKEIREEGLEEYSPLHYDDDSLKETGIFLITQGISFIGENSRGIVGFILGTLEYSIMDKKQLIGAERLWCVKKEYRGNRIGLALLKKFEDICKYRGASHILVGSIVSLNYKSMDKLYKRLGYTHIEEHYAKRIS